MDTIAIVAVSVSVIVMPHRTHLHRCDLLLQMSHVAWSVCLSVCVSVLLATRVSCAKRLNRLRCRLEGGGRADLRWLKEPCIRWVDIPHGNGQLWRLSGPFKSTKVSAAVNAAKKIIQDSITARQHHYCNRLLCYRLVHVA